MPVSRLAWILAALAVPGAAAAQDQRPVNTAEMVTDLAYGYCPLFLAGQFPLTENPQLARFGFGPVQNGEQAGLGPVQSVTVTRPEGQVAFGGAPRRLCGVTITGAGATAALARLREFLPMIGVEFAPDAGRSGNRSGVEVESFKGRVDRETFLNVQFLRSSTGTTPILSVQLFPTKE